LHKISLGDEYFMLLPVGSDILSLPPHSSTVGQTIVLEYRNRSHQNWPNFLADVRNSSIRFQVKWVEINDGVYQKLNYPIDRPYSIPITPILPGATRSPSAYKLRIFILNPSKVYWLSNIDDPKVLDELVKLLDDPNRGWAANVILSKMMGITGLGQGIDEVSPAQWWDVEGKTGKSKQEWSAYLQKVRPTMRWSILGGYYKHQTPDGFEIF
jgi:hypothetical protein